MRTGISICVCNPFASNSTSQSSRPRKYFAQRPESAVCTHFSSAGVLLAGGSGRKGQAGRSSWMEKIKMFRGCEARARHSTNGGLGTTACTPALMPSAAVACTLAATACHFPEEMRRTEKAIFFLKRLISHFYQIAPKSCTLNVVSSQMWMSLESRRGFTNCSWP